MRRDPGTTWLVLSRSAHFRVIKLQLASAKMSSSVDPGVIFTDVHNPGHDVDLLKKGSAKSFLKPGIPAPGTKNLALRLKCPIDLAVASVPRKLDRLSPPRVLD